MGPMKVLLPLFGRAAPYAPHETSVKSHVLSNRANRAKILDFRLPVLADLRATERSLKLAYDERNVSRRLWGADVCARAAAGERESPDLL